MSVLSQTSVAKQKLQLLCFVNGPISAIPLIFSAISVVFQTCVARAWDPARPVYHCPAMNTYMWQHPLTQEHLQSLHSLKYIQIPPVSKTLACGDCGKLWLVEIVLIFVRDNKIPGMKVLSLAYRQSGSAGRICGYHSYTCS